MVTVEQTAAREANEQQIGVMDTLMARAWATLTFLPRRMPAVFRNDSQAQVEFQPHVLCVFLGEVGSVGIIGGFQVSIAKDICPDSPARGFSASGEEKEPSLFTPQHQIYWPCR